MKFNCTETAEATATVTVVDTKSSTELKSKNAKKSKRKTIKFKFRAMMKKPKVLGDDSDVASVVHPVGTAPSARTDGSALPIGHSEPTDSSPAVDSDETHISGSLSPPTLPMDVDIDPVVSKTSNTPEDALPTQSVLDHKNNNINNAPKQMQQRQQHKLSKCDYVARNQLFYRFMQWMYTDFINNIISVCFYATEVEGRGTDVLYFRKPLWSRIVMKGKAQLESNFVPVILLFFYTQ